MKDDPTTDASCREQMRKAEEEGRRLPQRGRRQPADAQDASLDEGEACEEGKSDAEPVSTDQKNKGGSDPAARGRDAPVDVR
jgi:hypothetical protein